MSLVHASRRAPRRITLTLSVLVTALIILVGSVVSVTPSQLSDKVSTLPDSGNTSGGSSLACDAGAAEQVTLASSSASLGAALIPDYQALAVPNATEPKTVAHDGARLTIGPAAVAAPVNIGITPLLDGEVAELDAGMTNVTAGPRRGYRFTPHPFRFRTQIEISVPYDPAMVSSEFTAQDVYTYFFNDRDGCWAPLERVSVDEKNHRIISRTDHFTDMVNATVAVPDHPEGSSFNPTQIKDIQAADPGSNINLIASPVPNNAGDNRLAYPIDIPPGRGGLQPQLGVQYNSSSGNGWLGMGWDLPMQAIVVDTRWGVPRYRGDLETETYLMGGEQLTPVAHRGDLQPRTAEKVFHTRIEGQFARIVRHGDNPANYTWEVTDKAGTRWFYGGVPGTNGPAADSTLTDGTGNVYLWALREVRDANGNLMRYHCVRVDDAGVSGGTVPGTNLYLQRISYTGFGDTEGSYSVTFLRDREVDNPWQRRADVSIDARGGFKRVTADLLRRIEVRLGDALIRRYEFTYTTGAFFKTLLKSVAQFGEDGALFNTHAFDYFDDIRNQDGAYQAFENVDWISPDDQLGNDVLNLLPGAGEASALNAHSSAGGGGHLYVGVGSSPTKSGSVGLKVGFSHEDDKGLLALVDVDGDTLPDKVFADRNTIKYRKNLSKPAGEARFADTTRPLDNLPAIMGESNNTLTLGVEGYAGPAAAQLDYVNTFTTSGTYFSDVNGDGITDLVNGGSVLFGRIGAGGTPVYGVSGQTPVPIGAGTVDATNLFGDFAADRDRMVDSFPLLDSVRRWVAPFTGTVKIDGAVQLSPATAAERAASRTADGVRVAIQHEDTELWSQVIDAQDNAAFTPAGVGAIPVTRGQRIYFRVQSNIDGGLDQVSWNPQVSYLGQVATPDVNGLDAFRYQTGRDFTLGGRSSQVKVPLTGTLRLGGELVKRAATTDDVTVLITRDGAPVFDQTLSGATAGTIPIDLEIPVQQGQTLKWRVKVDSPIDLDQIDWTPSAHYTAAEGVDRVTDNAGNHVITVDPPYDLDMYPANDLTAPQGFFDSPQDGTLTVEPTLTFDFGVQAPDGRVAFTVKRRGELLGRRFFDITDGQVTTPAPFTVPVTAGDDLFFDFATLDPKLREFLTSRSVRVTFDNNSFTPVPNVFHSATVEDAFPQPYRGWGAIGYNGNRDRATQPIVQNDLVINEDYGDQLPDSVNPQAQRDEFAENPRINPPKVIAFVPSPKAKRWGAGEHSWVARDTVSSSRLGVESINLPTPGDFEGATAVPRLSRSEQISLTGGVSGGIGTVGGSIATGSSTGQLDFLDMNGDQFPDVVGAGAIQYTDMVGGLGDTRGDAPEDGVRRSTNVSGNASAGSAARTIGTGRGHDAPPGHVSANTSASGNDMPPLGVGASLGAGESDGRFDLLDINGDDLPDRVYDNGDAALNLGYSFAGREPWPGGVLNDGASNNFGVNIGFNTDFYGFAGGASFSQGASSSAETLMDLNGDGLMDRVFDGHPITVALNTGNGFAVPTPFAGSLSDLTGDQNARLGGGVYFTFGICFVAVCIVINPGGDISTGSSRAERSLRDINGDGYADHLSSTNDGELVVKRNRTDRTNLLRSVARPLGARMDFEYARDGNTYEQPQSRWVLSRVAMHDGQAGDGADVQLSTYEYSGGYFDRLERTFYGYATVTERHRDPGASDAVLRSITREFHNDDFYRRGLLRRELTADGAGRPFLETEHTYQLRDVFTGLPAADGKSTTATIFPLLSRTDERFFEGQSSPGKSTFTELEYDSVGNMTRSFDAADTGPADDLDVRMRYTAEDPACQASYIVGIANVIDAFGAGTLMRHRESRVDCASSDVTQVRARLTDTDTAVTDLEYFPNGNLKAVIGPQNKAGQRYRLDYAYDPVVGVHVESITDSFGYQSKATHNLKYGAMETSTDFNNQVLRNVYDTVGRVDRVIGPYEAPENRVTIDFEYHPEAPVPYAVTRHVDRTAGGAVRTDTIDTIMFVDGLKRTLQTKKDASLHTSPGTAPAAVMTVSGRVRYDAFGRVVEQFYPVTEPKGATNSMFNPAFDSVTPTRLSYDILDRTTRTIIPDNTGTTMVYGFGPDRAGVTQFETVITDGNGIAKRNYRDVRGLTTSVKEFNAAGSQPVIWTSYTHDPLSQLTAVIDDRNNTTASVYDNFGRRTVIDNPDTGRTQTGYDLADNPIRAVTANLAGANQAVEYDYDFNRLAAIRYPVFSQNNVTYSYGGPGAPNNAAARISGITDGAGSVARRYGPLGELTEERRIVPVPGGPNRSYTTKYVYDTWNRMLQMTFPDGEVLSYTYNTGGLVEKTSGRKGRHSYPYLNRLDYDKFEQRVLLDTGNGTRSQYTYDPTDRRLATMRAQLKNRYVFQNMSYDYDNVGNVLSIQNNTLMPGGQSGLGNELGGPGKQTFAYDDLYRLTSASGEYRHKSDKVDQYRLTMAYDTIHNTTAKNQVHEIAGQSTLDVQQKTTYNYPYAYAGTKPHAPNALGPYDMSYDPNGNLTSRFDRPVEHRRQLIWDEENRLACTHEDVRDITLGQNPSSCDEVGEDPAVRFRYDDEGNRVVKDASQIHIYPNQNFSQRAETSFKHVFIGESRLVTKIVKPDGGFEDHRFFYHSDHLGSTGFATDEKGELVEHQQYFPSGESWVTEHPVLPVPYQFSGKEIDPETGLYYFGARYYDPRTSVWQNADPDLNRYFNGLSRGGVYNSLNLNLYAYSHHNPVKYTDPNGKWIESAWDAISLGTGVVSLVDNVRQGNGWAAALDAVGVIADGAALVLPVVPGGAGVAIKAARAGNAAVDIVRGADRASDVARAVDRTADATRAAGRAASGADNAAHAAGGGTETFYRAMSNAEFDSLSTTGRLAPRGESFVTQDLGYVQQLAARHPDLYEQLVRFDMAPGTRQALTDAGARSPGRLLEEAGLGHLPLIQKGMPNVVHVKGELGAINYGLRSGSADIFNCRITGFCGISP